MSTVEKMIESANREIKSSAFTTYFGDPENAAALYRALDQAEDIRAEDIEYKTLSGVLFMARKNDMAFTVRKKVLVISEHQSTVNANMPLRDAIYYGRTMEKLIEPKALYKTGKILIPTPEFYVFYNGDTPYPIEKTLRLSDAYLEKREEPMLELVVRVININLPENQRLYHQKVQSGRGNCSCNEGCREGGYSGGVFTGARNGGVEYVIYRV